MELVVHCARYASVRTAYVRRAVVYVIKHMARP